jgi:hypothetical protein
MGYRKNDPSGLGISSKPSRPCVKFRSLQIIGIALPRESESSFVLLLKRPHPYPTAFVFASFAPLRDIPIVQIVHTTLTLPK